MAVEVMAWAFDQELPPAKKLLLLAIANHASPDGTNAWPSVATLAKKCSVSTRYVRQMLRELEADGWITADIQAGGTVKTAADRRPNLYTIHLNRGERGEPQFRGGRNPSSPRGGNPSSPEPSLEPSVNRPSWPVASDERGRTASKSPERPSDALWEAVVAEVGLDTTQLTKSRRGALNASVKQLRDVGATPEDVRYRAKTYRTLWPSAVLTETALAKHWAALAPLRRQVAPSITADPDCLLCGGTFMVVEDSGAYQCPTCMERLRNAGVE